MGRLAPRAAALALVLAACASPAPPKKGVVHELKAGETIYRLSRYYGVPADEIVRVNHIADVSDVPVGARLFVPGARRSAAREPIALASVAPPASDLRLQAEREAELHFAWPLHGKLSSRFGWRRGRRHEGIDISARPGTPIRAAEAGRVIHAGTMGGYGRVVIVKHAGNYSSVYAHNRRNRVSKGQFVEKGDLLGEVGSTGNATGPHLHFEVRRRRQPQDPLGMLP